MTKQFIEEHIEWLAKLDPRLVPVEIAYSAIYREKLKKLILATEEEIRKRIQESQLAELMRFYASNRGSGHTYASVNGVKNVSNAVLLVADEKQKQSTGLPLSKQVSRTERGMVKGGQRIAIVADHYALQRMFDDLLSTLTPKE